MAFYYLQTQAVVTWHLKRIVLLAIPDSAHPGGMNVHSK